MSWWRWESQCLYNKNALRLLAGLLVRKLRLSYMLVFRLWSSPDNYLQILQAWSCSGIKLVVIIFIMSLMRGRDTKVTVAVSKVSDFNMAIEPPPLALVCTGFRDNIKAREDPHFAVSFIEDRSHCHFTRRISYDCWASEKSKFQKSLKQPWRYKTKHLTFG